MKKILLPFAALLLISCSARETLENIETPNPEVEVWGEQVSEDDLIAGQITVKVSDELASELESLTGSDGYVNVAKTKASSVGIRRMKQLFFIGGEFEQRQRAYGLHKWYVMEYDESMSTTKVAGGISNMEGIEEIEYPVKIKPVEISDKIIYAVHRPDIVKTAAAPFNDPNYSRQWHYYNNGSASSSVSGCDINVVPVWENYTTGSQNIVVAVVDQGVDYSHEDLAANMWNNPSQSGTAKYGYNFATSSYVIHPGDHGTHVAGTIAAVNNNGKGVCGIAGGNAAKNIKGVKIMSCQIFDGNMQGSGAAAIQWACDHGAHIAQNSWGRTSPSSINPSLQEAVKYFTDNAGLDSKGAQTGPIKGGLVFFSAGNDNSSQPYGTYDPNGNIINVASVGADYRKAYYSNYGEWVNITAPGGDVYKGNQVLSTFTGGKYGSYQGTSMACPHVSGVAALIIAVKGGKGVTNTTIRDALLKNVTDISSFNPNFQMGTGLVNAYKAIAGSGGKAPAIPTDLTATPVSNTFNISVTVPSDEDDKKPTSIAVYYSKNSFTSSKGQQYALFYVGDLAVGETLTGTINGLDFETKYYLAAEAIDLADNHSKMTSLIEATTGANIPPEINPHGGSVTLKGHENPKLTFEVKNPAKHYCNVYMKWKYDDEQVWKDGPSSAPVALDTLDKSKPAITFHGSKLKDNSKGVARLKVVDLYGDADSCDVSFTVLQNHAPKIGKTFPNVLFNSRNDDPVKYVASQYFTDEDGETLSYIITLDGASVNFVYEKGNFILTPMEYGYTDVTVVAKDVRGQQVSQSFRCLVRQSDNAVDVYPNPVKDYLYFRSSDNPETPLEQANAKIKVIAPTGQTYYKGDLTITAFDPGVVNMTYAGPGLYSVSVEYGSQTYKYNIVKL